jgi:hypothetical protein
MSTIIDQYQPNEEIQEIIGQVPGWVIRWGISVFLALLLIVVGISKYLYLPVSIKAKANLNAREQYFRVVWMKTEPSVDYLPQVSDGMSVQKNDTILIESNTATGKKRFYTAPTNGTVAIFKGTEEMPRASVLMVVPEFTTYDVELHVPINGAGQLRKGQKVILRLNEFPESKYGFLIGKVASRPLVPIDRFYRVKVALTNGLTTNINQKIPVQAVLNGEAEVITENLSVFDKVFGGIL